MASNGGGATRAARRASPRRRATEQQRSSPRTGALLAVLVLLLAGCGSGAAGLEPTSPAADGSPAAAGSPASPVDGALGAFYDVPTPLSPGPPGSLVRVARLSAAGLPAGASASRVVYHSETAAGADVAVSGMVVVPGGTPPRGGFPIVTWAHGTTGLAPSCAPSFEGASAVPFLAALVGSGAIVAATDYEGLGVAADLHPYLVGLSEGQDVLDAARAARALAGGRASNTVIVAGHSQGGQAALFAGQIAQSYAPELFVAGVAAAAPVTSVLEFGPEPHRPTDGSIAYLLMAVDAWSHTYGNLPLASVLTSRAFRAAGVLTSGCAAGIEAAYDRLSPAALLVAGWSANPALVGDDAANRPGQAPTAAPLLVLQGTADAVVPESTTSRFVADQLCGAEHDAVDYAADRGRRSHRRALRGRAGPPPLDRATPREPAGTRHLPALKGGWPDGAPRAGQTSRKRRTAKAEPTTPTPMPTIATRMQVPATSQPPSDICTMMFDWLAAVFVAFSPMP